MGITDMNDEDQILNMISDEFSVLVWMLIKLILFAMLLERALYFVFDYELWRELLSGKKVKAPITLAIAWYACIHYSFDIVSPVLDPMAGSTSFGLFLTALIIAGGSASAMILFQDILNFSRDARTRIQAVKEAEHGKKLSDINNSQSN